MHLYIEQNTGLTENVSSSVVKKLYELAVGGTLDNTSDLKGTLHTTVASISHVEYLENHFPDLHITANEYGLSFEDPNVEQLCINNWGSNGAITVNQIRSVSTLGQVFKNNTDIAKFNEFSYFTGVDSTNWGLFAGCTNLTEITLPNAVTTITSYGFQDCTKLTTINNFNKVNRIEQYGLQRCGLTSLEFSGSIFIGAQGCDAMPNLTSVTFNGDVTGTMYKMFSDCKALQTITFNAIVTELPANAFIGCSSLTTLDLSNIASFNSGGGQFSFCTGVTSIIFNSQLTSIPPKFMTYAGNVTFTIPASVTSIGSEAFGRTSTTITCLGTTPPTLPNTYTLGNVVAIYVPASAVETYKTATNWDSYAAKISAIPS